MSSVVTPKEWQQIAVGMAKRIGAARRKSGCTHGDVAKATDTTTRTSKRWCSGSAVPSLSTLICLSRLFQCKLSDLTGVQ